MAEKKKTPKEATNVAHNVIKASVIPKTGMKRKPKQKKKMYTEAELLQAIKYACEYQKAADYQIAGRLLIVDDSDLIENSVKLLDDLANENNAFAEIELKDIF